MHRHELSDQQWARIEPFLPHRTHRGKAGHPFNDHHRIINGILWILHTGAPWRDLLERYGPWETVYYRFNRWRYDGTWVRMVTAMLDKLDDLGKLDHDLWCIDGTIIRASRAAAGARRMSRRPRILGGARRLGCGSRRTMAWGDRGAASGRRSTWPATAAGTWWGSTSQRVRPTRAGPSSRRWPGGCSTAVMAGADGLGGWPATRATVTRGSGVGAGGERSSL